MKSVHLQIRRAPNNDDIPLPQYMSTHASGMDICAAVTCDTVIHPNTVTLIPTGLYMAVDPGYEIQVRPRSGLALKHGITLVNSPGTIDADYRGEIGIIMGNIGREPFTVTRGMRIAQLVIQEVVQAVIVEVDTLSSTTRGEGGFGSSGTH